MQWFGIRSEESRDGETDSGTDEVGDDSGDTVDRPDVATPSKPSPSLSERDKRRIEVVLSRLEEAMTGTEFLAERGPDYLAADLKVAAALLRVGLRENWVEGRRFFDLTQKIWSSLFFSSEPRKEVGWLEHRANMAADREAFVNDMRSPELSAALIGWKLAVPSDYTTPELARFALAAVLAVARLPWLWQGGEPEKIAEQLTVLLSQTADPRRRKEDLLGQAEAEWHQLLRRGQALRHLEAAVGRMTPAELRGRIRTDRLVPGDLLWQGTAGFCVVREEASRDADDKVQVLRLQGGGREAQFKADFTVPIRALLSEEVVPRTDSFGDEPRLVLRKFIDELSRGFAR